MPNHTLTVYCTPEEATAIKRAAHRTHRSVSDYIVTVALEHILGTRRTRIQLQQAVAQVNKPGKKAR